MINFDRLYSKLQVLFLVVVVKKDSIENLSTHVIILMEELIV